MVPGYKVHTCGGIVAYGILMYFLKDSCHSKILALEWLLFALVGSLFPDIDIKSKAQRIFYQFLAAVCVVLILARKFIPVVFIGSFAMLPMIVRHRGLFHKWWFLISLPFVVIIFVNIYIPAYFNIVLLDTCFFIVGALSHLLLDFGV